MSTAPPAQRTQSFTAPVVAVLLAVTVLTAALAAARMARAFENTWVILAVVPSDGYLYGLPVPEGLPPGSRAHVLGASYSLQVDNLPLSLRLLVAAGTALGPLALAVVAAVASRLLWAAARRGPWFTRGAPQLLSLAAAAVAVAGVGAPLVERRAAEAVLAHLGPALEAPVEAAAAPDLWWAVVAVGVLALAPVFARGRRLEHAAGGPSA